jgi:hypothetical protein
MESIPRDEEIAMGASLLEISPEVPMGQRQIIVIKNISTGGESVALGFGKNAVIGKGVNLTVSGVWVESIDAVYKPTNLRITAIGSGPGSIVAIHERIV